MLCMHGFTLFHCSVCLFLSVFAGLVTPQLLNNYMIKSFIQSLMYHVRHSPTSRM